MTIFDEDDGESDALLERVAYMSWMVALRETPLPPNPTRKELVGMGRIATRAMVRAIKDTYQANVSAALVEGITAGMEKDN